jgi:hypothetical protein
MATFHGLSLAKGWRYLLRVAALGVAVATRVGEGVQEGAIVGEEGVDGALGSVDGATIDGVEEGVNEGGDVHVGVTVPPPGSHVPLTSRSPTWSRCMDTSARLT